MVVDLGLTVGALVGVLLSGGFVYTEIGRYATPQVPETLFDERREVFAYTAGLFVGIPLAIAFLFFLDSMANGAIPGAAIFLVGLVAGTEVAQWALLRSHYWGVGASGPFYALGYRAGIAGIFALAIIAQYLAITTPTWDGILLVLIESAAILALEVAGALLSLPPSTVAGRTGRWAGARRDLRRCRVLYPGRGGPFRDQHAGRRGGGVRRRAGRTARRDPRLPSYPAHARRHPTTERWVGASPSVDPARVPAGPIGPHQTEETEEGSDHRLE